MYGVIRRYTLDPANFDESVRRAEQGLVSKISSSPGFVSYRVEGGGFTLVHTEVEPELEHRGVASQLVAAALDDIRARGLPVVPICPFVRGFIRRHPEYADLVGTR